MTDYLADNETFYARFWREQRGYRNTYPNSEEAARAGAVMSFVSAIIERRGHDAAALTLLDVGCGRGWLTNLLSCYGQVAGCDAAAGGPMLARELFPALTFHHGTLGALLADHTIRPVDVIVSSEVLEHVPHDAQPQFVAELRRGLVPGGHCIITTPRREVFDIAGDSSAQQVEEWLTEPQVEQLFRSVGFLPHRQLRVCPLNGYLPDRVAHRLRRFSPRLRPPRVVRSWLDDRSALYQAWWFTTSETAAS